MRMVALENAQEQVVNFSIHSASTIQLNLFDENGCDKNGLKYEMRRSYKICCKAELNTIKNKVKTSKISL